MEDFEIMELQCWLTDHDVDMGIVKDAVRAMSTTMDGIAKIMKGCKLAALPSEWFVIESLVTATGRDCG